MRLSKSILAFCFLMLLANPAVSQSAKTKRPPNIVLILADDVGCEGLGCYGGESYPTPNLDQLAKTGMQFRHCYSMPVCHPTRTTLLTGQYPFQLKHPKWGSFPQAEEQNTLPHALKKAGYKTAVAGKWQLALMKNDPHHPKRLGFDESCLFGWHEGPRYHSPMIYQNGKVREGLEESFGPDVYVEFLTDFMKQNKDQPFFAFYSMALCHDVTDDLKQPVPFGPDGHYLTFTQMMKSLDQHVGQLVSAIDQLGLRENTLILFTCDNGTPSSYLHTAENGKYIRKPFLSKINGELVRGGKGNLSDDGTHVPLIANWKGKIAPGQTVDDLVDMSDFLPTSVELATGKAASNLNISGVSFAPRLNGGTDSARTWAFAQGRGKAWVRTTRFKLYSDGKLFDVQNNGKEKSPIQMGSATAEAARTQLSSVLKKLNFPLAESSKSGRKQ